MASPKPHTSEARPQASHARPLSPHLGIYRWTLPMALSILHRLSGLVLYGGMVLVAVFLWALASGNAAYALLDAALHSVAGEIFLLLWAWVLLHHMVGGLRHFVWDKGRGYSAGGIAVLSWLSVLLPLAGAVLVGLAIWGVL